MCRLFALAADQPVTARFWMLDAPYSLRYQSQFNADGTGIGWFDERGRPQVAKRPVAAYESTRFERFAVERRARTLIAHLRLSSGTSTCLENTHPFEMDGIIAAHNGVLEVTPELKEQVRRLGTADLVAGTTDTEWMIALIAGETRRASGDLRDGIVAALSWIARHVPVYSVNLVIGRENELFAVRLPATNELWVLDRPAGAGAAETLEASSADMTASSDDLQAVHSVVIASEPMDDSEGWRLMDDGELVHVDPDGRVTSESPFPALRKPLRIEDLGLSAAASQAHAAAVRDRQERRSSVAA